MLKITIAIVIFILSTTIGYIYGDSFRKRVIHLKEIYKAIILLQNEIVYNNTPLPIALYDVAVKGNKPLSTLLVDVSKRLKEGEDGDVYSNFKTVFKRYEQEFYLEKGDKSVLEDFIKSLGESGVYGQEKIFNLTLESLKINIDEAVNNAKKNVKLYRTLGISIGAMIAIFFV